MFSLIRNIVIASMFIAASGAAHIVSAEENEVANNVRTLNKQEVIALISNKKITYLTAAAASISSVTEGTLQLTFTKTEDAGGTLVAYTNRSSSTGTWHVDDNAKLVRQYEMVKWGNKPFRCSIVEKSGKFFVRFGAAEDHEIVKIE